MGGPSAVEHEGSRRPDRPRGFILAVVNCPLTRSTSVTASRRCWISPGRMSALPDSLRRPLFRAADGYPAVSKALIRCLAEQAARHESLWAACCRELFTLQAVGFHVDDGSEASWSSPSLIGPPTCARSWRP